jgi:hypothetical protein
MLKPCMAGKLLWVKGRRAQRGFRVYHYALVILERKLVAEVNRTLSLETMIM